MTREQRVDHTVGETFNFKHKSNDLVAKGIVVPKGSPAWAFNGEALWSQALAAEMTIDRKTREYRLKKQAQVAKHFVLSLPHELTDIEREQLTKDFIQHFFADAGVAVEWAIHAPETGSTNHHLHLLVSTRRLGPSGFGKKARELNPGFGTGKGRHYVSEGNAWDKAWSDFQDAWFIEHGIKLDTGETLRTDPPRAVRSGHVRFETDDSIAQAADDRVTAANALRHDQGDLIDLATERQAVFTRRDLSAILRKHGIVGAEAEQLVEKALCRGDVLELSDDAGNDAGFTTIAIRREEMVVLSTANRLANGPSAKVRTGFSQRLMDEMTLSTEQRDALLYQLQRSFSITQGDPGTGKSHGMKALRLVLEDAGYNVIGLAPTNAVSADMRRDGFKSSNTLHSLIWQIENGRLTLDPKTVFIIDEAAMTDLTRLRKLLEIAQAAGAAVHLVGDDKQLGAVGRGGLYSKLKEIHGAAFLSEITRQKGWQQEASKALAAGRVADALGAYRANGCIEFAQTVNEAESRLISEWNGSDFVFASTNVSVSRLNTALQATLIAHDILDSKAGRNFQTSGGPVRVHLGERIQMRGNLKKAGILNGTLGQVTAIEPDLTITVKLEDDSLVKIPPSFKDWGLGYAGTVYRGQGKTLTGCVALHDNPMAWNRQSGLVGLTRHKASFKLYTSADVAPDFGSLVAQFSRDRSKKASVDFEASPYIAVRPKMSPRPEPKQTGVSSFRPVLRGFSPGM